MVRFIRDTKMLDDIPKPHHTVNEVMRTWPQTISLFMDYGMACAGCPVGSFHTVEEAALEYRIPLHRFLSELGNVAANERQDEAPKKLASDQNSSDERR